MKIILTKDVEKLGSEGKIIEVKDGYARNYLIPEGLASRYSSSNFRIYEEKKRAQERKDRKEEFKAEAVKNKIESLSITIPMEVGEGDKIFGSVTPRLVSETLLKEGHKIEHRDIIIDEPIKELGVYTIKICLHPEVYANLKVWVVSKEEI
ncbi:50S ribosomal protein L9 [candidate division WOR-3 bacterium]|nr:50S ribosomal protein L9 [candidate division WOR-3 bacterium]